MNKKSHIIESFFSDLYLNIESNERQIAILKEEKELFQNRKGLLLDRNLWKLNNGEVWGFKLDKYNCTTGNYVRQIRSDEDDCFSSYTPVETDIFKGGKFPFKDAVESVGCMKEDWPWYRVHDGKDQLYVINSYIEMYEDMIAFSLSIYKQEKKITNYLESYIPINFNSAGVNDDFKKFRDEFIPGVKLYDFPSNYAEIKQLFIDLKENYKR